MFQVVFQKKWHHCENGLFGHIFCLLLLKRVYSLSQIIVCHVKMPWNEPEIVGIELFCIIDSALLQMSRDT